MKWIIIGLLCVVEVIIVIKTIQYIHNNFFRKCYLFHYLDNDEKERTLPVKAVSLESAIQTFMMFMEGEYTMIFGISKNILKHNISTGIIEARIEKEEAKNKED